ncbi:MAG: ABC transporter permease, partial [Elainellaceae cyanobacterium]
MTWWQKLQDNSLARLGIAILVILYSIALSAEFVAPYDAYSTQASGSFLPPTQIYWRSPEGRFVGPHIYPTTLGPVDLDSGERELETDYSQPAPLRLFVTGTEYRYFQVKLPLPTQFSFSEPEFEDVELLPGIPGRRHLFGVANGEDTAARINLLGTDEQARDQFSRLVYGSRISLSIGLIGIAISFPLGMLVGGISGYFGGAIDAVLMRIVEVLMTIPTIYLLIALAGILPAGLSSSQRFALIVLITSFVSWSGLARVIRGQVLSIKQRAFIRATKAMGGRSLYTIVRHVLPQTATYVIIASTLAIPSFIVAEAVLSLIGLGIQQPDPSWGNMLSLATNASVLVLYP